MHLSLPIMVEHQLLVVDLQDQAKQQAKMLQHLYRHQTAQPIPFTKEMKQQRIFQPPLTRCWLILIIPAQQFVAQLMEGEDLNGHWEDVQRKI
jgi:hypothetical protein